MSVLMVSSVKEGLGGLQDNACLEADDIIAQNTAI